MDNRRVRLTKRILQEALIDELQTTPLIKISIKELCRKADVNRSTFYAHYADLYELFSEIEDAFLSHIPFFTPGMTQKEKMSGIQEFVHYAQVNRDTFTALIHNGQFLTKFIALSLRASASGQTADYRTNLLTSYMVTGSIALLYEWLGNPSACSENLIASLLLELSVHAETLR